MEEWYREIFLDCNIACFLYWDFAERTQSNYTIVQKSYIFCYGIHNITAFPTTIWLLSSLITKIGLKRFLHKSIKLYMTGLRFYYVELRISKQNFEIFHTLVFLQVIAGIRHFNKKPNVKKQYPIT